MVGLRLSGSVRSRFSARLRALPPITQHLLVVIGIVIGTLVLRFPSFSRSVIDWDESIYLLIARDWMRGALPYTTIWDHKPPGLYLGFVMAQLLFGQSYTAIRALLCVVSAVSAYLLYRFGRDILRSNACGVLAAACYLLGSLKSEGLSGHPEMLFSPFVILGFLLTFRAVRGTQRPLAYAAAIGLAFGLAMQIKFSVIFDFAAALAILLIWQVWFRRSATLARAVGQVALAVAAFALPALVVIGGYALAGQLPGLYNAEILSNALYVQLEPFSWPILWDSVQLQLGNYPLFWAAALAAPLLLLRQNPHVDRARLLGLLGWMVSSAAAIGLSKLFYENYFLQILPPLCLVSAYVAVTIYRALRARRTWAAAGVLMVITLGLLHLTIQPLQRSATWLIQRRYRQLDTPARVAATIRPQLGPGETIFVADYEPILYYMLDVPLPTHYIVPRVLTTPAWAKVAQVDRLRELDAIMARPPQFVILPADPEDDPFMQQLAQRLAREYAQPQIIQDVAIYRRSS